MLSHLTDILTFRLREATEEASKAVWLRLRTGGEAQVDGRKKGL